MKIQGPLHSEIAKGTIASFLTFSKRKTGQQARFQKKQKDVITADRTVQRNKFLDAISRWKTRDLGIAELGFSFLGMDPAGFEAKGDPLNITGYNYFIKDFLIVGE